MGRSRPMAKVSPSRKMGLRKMVAVVWLLVLMISRAHGIIVFRDPGRQLEPPADVEMRRCWDLHGAWQGATGVLVAKDWFITAAHMGTRVGAFFDWGDRAYRTTEAIAVPNSDLMLFRVDGEFPDWVELWEESNGNEAERPALLIGRGCARGAQVELPGQPSPGWFWGESDGRLSWGQNEISHVFEGGETIGQLLVWTWDRGGPDLEGTLGVGDSGGGVFLKDDQGRWRLAGIHFDVEPSVGGADTQYSLSETDDLFWAAIHDGRSLWKGALGMPRKPVEVLADQPAPMWAGASRISPHASYIKSALAHALPVETRGTPYFPERSSLLVLAGAGVAGLGAVVFLTGWLRAKFRKS